MPFLGLFRKMPPMDAYPSVAPPLVFFPNPPPAGSPRRSEVWNPGRLLTPTTPSPPPGLSGRSDVSHAPRRRKSKYGPGGASPPVAPIILRPFWLPNPRSAEASSAGAKAPFRHRRACPAGAMFGNQNAADTHHSFATARLARVERCFPRTALPKIQIWPRRDKPAGSRDSFAPFLVAKPSLRRGKLGGGELPPPRCLLFLRHRRACPAGAKFGNQNGWSGALPRHRPARPGGAMFPTHRAAENPNTAPAGQARR